MSAAEISPGSRDQPDLLARARSGEEQAWDQLLEDCVPYLRVLAQRELYGALRGRVDPSDVVQMTCLEAHRDLHGFRGSSMQALLGWLRRILEHNVAGLVARHLAAEKRSLLKEQVLDGSRPGAEGAGLRSTVTSPSQRAMRGEEALQLASALSRLPEDQREAVRLRHIEGSSLAEMAERFGRTPVAVASLLKRGLQGLREHLPASGSQTNP